ncbi:Protein-S-isoprenylcysteine O-methyltransferase Ste14 [Dehalogenimonas formicexedens]|uniref:Protein-S-isoprenylcysteine O-methyltransferase Ste14 n=1 Tax=Dehalogenimonas formicexedens TaxID=1839801 RepID=A0A1P8F9P2_9CHLR|nr:methyltransferase [Dehalogenimonas formicexedens]APV45187.1 Protein-S-isoprenylcysteine O-methyltransferase Ste14 [Dehalogenimonas formicexedens]
MKYILMGSAGFLLMHLLDLASMKKMPFLKPILSFCGTALIAISLVMVAVTGVKFGLSGWMSMAGWIVFMVSISLMAYSLYFALPAGDTYIKSGTSGQLVTRGIYALVRHPWLLFFALSMAGLVIGSRSVLAFQAGLAWTILSLVLVYLQDRKIFPRMFSGYSEYRKTTPMLLPNQKSVTAFIEGLKQNKVPEV